jgi:hypothetical protein
MSSLAIHMMLGENSRGRTPVPSAKAGWQIRQVSISRPTPLRVWQMEIAALAYAPLLAQQHMTICS